MNPKPHLSFAGNLLVFFFIPAMLFFASCSSQVEPEIPVGSWSATQETTVRFKAPREPFRFVSDTVGIAVNIHDDGTVDGSVGEADFEGCSIRRNRGNLGRQLNLATDFVITGKLRGSIFPQDTLVEKPISMPFNMKDNFMDGAIFQKNGMGIFPMVNIHLARQ
ncbi:MAG: hypothetical protein HY842_15110 [Bacteroidetes bacterium]|nr:hypothetical protein [Bacteroidota bacterium]